MLWELKFDAQNYIIAARVFGKNGFPFRLSYRSDFHDDTCDVISIAVVAVDNTTV